MQKAAEFVNFSAHLNHGARVLRNEVMMVSNLTLQLNNLTLQLTQNRPLLEHLQVLLPADQ